jgi:low temperature requirement protein LtrA
MGATLLMALEVPDAFGEGSAWFGVTYSAVRLLASGFYWVESKDHPTQRAASITFFPLSFAAASLTQTDARAHPSGLSARSAGLEPTTF